MKASDIPDAAILTAVGIINREQHRWAFTYDLEAQFPVYPRKVLRAKCRRLINRKLMRGCACGCRGDFEVESIA